MVEDLEHRGYLRTPRVIDAFRTVPREEFLSSHLRHRAYRDEPAPIGMGQTISAPHMVAIMAEALRVEDGQKILEVGTGSGYHAAILSHITGANGHVDSVESHPSLAAQARERLRRLAVSNVAVHEGDGSLGWPPHAPYQRVNVTCASPGVPKALRAQIEEGGILLIPIGRDPSRLVRAELRNGILAQEDLGPCAFVPLLGAQGYAPAPRNGAMLREI